MRKLFDHMDNIFRNAYDRYEDDPSPRVWQNINEQLPLIKRGKAGWKKGLIVLLSLSLFLVTYDYLISGSEKNNHSQKISGSAKNIHSKSENEIVYSRDIKPPGGEINKRIEEMNDRKKEVLGARNSYSENNYQLGTFQPEIAKSITKEAEPAKINIRSSYFHPYNFSFPDKITDQLNIFSATRQNIKKFVPYWTVTPILSYGRSAYKLDSDLPFNYRQATLIRQREKNELSYSAGLYTSYHFHRRFSFQMGIIYSNSRIQIDPQKIYAFNVPNGDIAYQYITSSGYAYIKPAFSSNPSVGDSISASQAKHSFKSFTVPVILKFNTAGPGRFSFHPGVGIGANYNFSARLETEVTDASNHETVIVNKLRGTRNFYWSAYADAEVQYRINHGVSLNFRPAFNYAFTPITDNEIVETFPYSISAGIGLTYKF